MFSKVVQLNKIPLNSELDEKTDTSLVSLCKSDAIVSSKLVQISK